MNSSQEIIPHLWFDGEAEDAAQFYTLLFDDSSMGGVSRYTEEGHDIHGQAKETVMTVEFEVAGYNFIGLNGGPQFSFTPAISFFVSCETENEIERLWGELSNEGEILMEMDSYPWSERYGWLNDRFGLSWQLSLDEEDVSQKITPSLLFVGDQHGRAEEAINYYTSIFEDSDLQEIFRYGAGEHEPEGMVKHARFTLHDEQFMAMDSAMDHEFGFNEAISLLINCESQEEIDRYWDKLSDGGDPKAQQCGWLKDQFGVSWQVFPTRLRDMMLDRDVDRVKRVTRAYLQMKKFDISALEDAFAGGEEATSR